MQTVFHIERTEVLDIDGKRHIVRFLVCGGDGSYCLHAYDEASEKLTSCSYSAATAAELSQLTDQKLAQSVQRLLSDARA